MLDEYELVSRGDLERLKSSALNSEKVTKSLEQSISELSAKIDELYELFDRANREIMEDVASHSVSEQQAKLDQVIKQNEQLAKGLLSIHKLLDKTNGRSYPLSITDESN